MKLRHLGRLCRITDPIPQETTEFDSVTSKGMEPTSPFNCQNKKIILDKMKRHQR